MRHRVKRVTMGKVATKHSSTIVNVTGQGSVAAGALTIYQVDAGQRDVFGATIVTKSEADTDNKLNIGDIVKYVNICLQVGNRNVDNMQEDNDNGWIEYGIVWQNQTILSPASTNSGLHTLGDILVKQFRGDVIWTGCLPVGLQQPTALDLKIKLPKKASKLVIGSSLTLFWRFRSVNSTDLRTDSCKVIASCMYKSYS